MMEMLVIKYKVIRDYTHIPVMIKLDVTQTKFTTCSPPTKKKIPLNYS